MPSKLSDVAGMFAANCVDCRAASTWSTWLETGRGFGLASISLAGVGGVGRTLRSGFDTSLLYECPTTTDLPGTTACGARGSGPATLTVMLRPEPPASTTPAPTDRAASANTATTTPGRPSRTPARFLKNLIPQTPFTDDWRGRGRPLGRCNTRDRPGYQTSPQRPTSTQALCPPRPIAFDSATSTSACRDSFGT